MDTLPTTPDTAMKNPRWSYLYAYNLRTLRDLFVYCSQEEEIPERLLYEAMGAGLIPPPKRAWIGKNAKRKERLRLEYIHAASYLGLIVRRNGVVACNLEGFSSEKTTILECNKGRVFQPSSATVPFKDAERHALVNIILGYERARDYLYWYLDFGRYNNCVDFDVPDFMRDGKPIFLLAKAAGGRKGSDTLRRVADGALWRIPELYLRLANFVFPGWFADLGLIDRVVVFPEFTEDKTQSHMYYPVKLSDIDFLHKDIPSLLEDLFLGGRDRISIWMPYLVYRVVLEYGCTIAAIKLALEKIYKKDYGHFYLERTSLPLMEKRRRYEDSYLKVNGFLRSHLIITRRSKSI